MFFIGIFGIQDKIQIIKEYNQVLCKCGCLTRGRLMQKFTYFHIFFIPVFRWNKQFFFQCRCCGRIYRVPDGHVDEYQNKDYVDLNLLDDVGQNSDTYECRYCGARLDKGFIFCPYCGSRIS